MYPNPGDTEACLSGDAGKLEGRGGKRSQVQLGGAGLGEQSGNLQLNVYVAAAWMMVFVQPLASTSRSAHECGTTRDCTYLTGSSNPEPATGLPLNHPTQHDKFHYQLCAGLSKHHYQPSVIPNITP